MIKLIPEISDRQLEWRNDERVWMFCRQNHIITHAQQADWLRKIHEDPTIQMLGVWCEAEEANVGTVGLTSISFIHRTAEYSMLLGPEYHGKGYARETLRALLEYGFSRLNLRLIWGEIIGNNEKALKIALNVGFRKEAELRSRYYKADQLYNSWIVSILYDEWFDFYRTHQ